MSLIVKLEQIFFAYNSRIQMHQIVKWKQIEFRVYVIDDFMHDIIVARSWCICNHLSLFGCNNNNSNKLRS